MQKHGMGSAGKISENMMKFEGFYYDGTELVPPYGTITADYNLEDGHILIVKLTREGIVADLIDEDGDIVGTHSATANEIAERTE